MQSHSVRLFENEYNTKNLSKVLEIVEQPIKIVVDGKPNTKPALGLILSETIFHPQGGGQPADKGTINNIPLLTVKEDKSQIPFAIFHYIDSNIINKQSFSIGQEVELILDDEFRQQCQRSHTAGHLLADILELHPSFNNYNFGATHGHHFPNSEYIKVVASALPENFD